MTENEALRYIRLFRDEWDRDSKTKNAEALDVAIEALEEIQQYRELGTVEEILKVFNNQRTIIAMQHETLKQYRAIGTIEDFKVLKEKSVAKKPEVDGLMCPNCKRYMIGNIKYCLNCGVKLD